MNLNQLFCLSGCGYLRDLYTSGDKLVAKIKVIFHADAIALLKKDEVWVDCMITQPEQQAYLCRLFSAVIAGSEVIVNFKAEYNVFICSYSVQEPSAPSHIVMLQAKLRLLEDCYIDGRLAEIPNRQLKTVA